MPINDGIICRKCQKEGTITIKKDSIYCESCYLTYINHKFRACIGKNKIITPNEKILVALSGGLGSTALLDMIHNGITLNTHKKLRIETEFVHLTGVNGGSNNQIADLMVEQCRKYGFNVHLRNISSYTSGIDITSCALNPILQTTSNDFQSRIKQNVLASIAKELNCRLIFTGEPATSLAAKLLCDLVTGRGCQVENDIAFADNRHDDIYILRPLRDITKEEIQQYLNIKSLAPVRDHNHLQNSLQSVIGAFVANLEKASPATISTICKTADKIGTDIYNEAEKCCIFCKGKMDNTVNKFTAIQATTFSGMVSHSFKRHGAQMEQIGNVDDEEIGGKPMFPFIHKKLCYCCSRSYAEMEGSKIQLYVQELIRK